MRKSLKVALYDPFLDTLGGGELHVLSILQVLSSCGYEPYIFWDKDLSREIKQKFSLHYINKIKWLPNIFKNKSFPFSILKTLKALRTFDCFIYVTDGSYFFSSAKKNFVFCMVPYKNLYQMNIVNRLKTFNYQFITNSLFTSGWLTKWGIQNQELCPYIDDVFFRKTSIKKERIILSVGRFFPHLHSKQHEIIIGIYKKFLQSRKNLAPYRLILAGGLKKEDENYFRKLQSFIGDDSSIKLEPNLGFNELVSLYQKAELFLHFTGFGVNENEHPEMVEHFGIAPLQAMASGCITFCYNAGGPKEFISDGKNGFLFNSEKELLQKINTVIESPLIQQKITKNAVQLVKTNFSYKVFEQKVKKLFL